MSLFTPTGDFYRACDAFTSNDPHAKALCARVIENPDTPRRYAHLAQLMWWEVETWKHGDLADIGRDMQKNARGLGDARVNKPLEQQIIDKLDRLIERLETPEPVAGLATNRPGDPGTQPQGNDAGKGQVDEVQLRKLAAEWGKLPPAERAKAIQELTSTLPPKWKGMIEDYYKGMGKYVDR